MSSLNPTELTNVVNQRLGLEFDNFPESIVTIHGQTISVTNKLGEWSEFLTFELLAYTVQRLKWGERFHDDDYVEWMFRSWVLDKVEENLNLKVLRAVQDILCNLIIDESTPDKVEEKLFQWAKSAAIESATVESSSLLWGVRFFYEWCLDIGLPNFSEYRQFELDSIRPAWRNQELAVLMRDANMGPYTKIEISLIEDAMIRSKLVAPFELALFYLAKDWGLRPIQLALLQTQDYGVDDLGPYIRVPSVKGIRRAKLRRAPSNMVKRYITDETARAVVRQIEIAKDSVQPNLASIAFFVGWESARKLGIPIFPNKYRTPARLERLCRNEKLINYALHLDSARLSRVIRKLTFKLNIPAPKRMKDSEPNKILEITAYRFRRTKGTSMVLGGATPEEVAEALDHVSSDSVQYYFRYNLDLHDFVNKTHAASPEINDAIDMWTGKIEGLGEPRIGELTIGSLGQCTLGSACPHHPTVTCYACPSFRPNRSADHRGALKSIEQFQSIIASSATGPVVQQLENSIYGAKALIMAIEGQGND
jgi:integrase